MLIGSFVGRGSFQYKGLEKAGQAACSGDSGEASGDRGEEREVMGDEARVARGRSRRALQATFGVLAFTEWRESIASSHGPHLGHYCRFSLPATSLSCIRPFRLFLLHFQ